MMRWRSALIVLALVALVVAGFTIETNTRAAGPSREALLNPWLAAARVLERRGLQVESVPVYGGLPARAQVMVLATPLDYLAPDEQDELLEWIRGGGHLVTALRPDPDADDTPDAEAASVLGKQLDVHLRTRTLTDAERKSLVKQPLRALRLQPGGLLQARLDARYSLRSGRLTPRWQAADTFGVHAARFALGQGRVTALSDLDWLNNRQLGTGDHAGLLWAVVDAPAGTRLWLVPGVERPSLLQLLWQRAAYLLLALALFVLAWLWAVTRRFGPLQPALPPARRRLAEHLEASGRYLLRHGGLPSLYDASRQRLLAQVQRRHPQWRGLAPAQLAQQLAQRARLEGAAVERVLTAPAPDHLPQFAADIRLLNRLRKAL